MKKKRTKRNTTAARTMATIVTRSERITCHDAIQSNRKLRKKQMAPALPTQQAVPEKEMEAKTDSTVPSRLEKAIAELQGLNEVLLSGDLDPRILADFRDALSRIRTAAWAAQQYVARKDIEQDSTSILSFLAGERIRATYQLCQTLSEDLKRPDIAVPAGSLIQLFEVMSASTEQLKGIVNKLG
jgi:hypothetical protein